MSRRWAGDQPASGTLKNQTRGSIANDSNILLKTLRKGASLSRHSQNPGLYQIRASFTMTRFATKHKHQASQLAR